MNKDFFKKMLKRKVEMAELVIDALPGPLQTPVKDYHRKVCQVVYDISKECLEREKMREKANPSSGFRSIQVED